MAEADLVSNSTVRSCDLVMCSQLPWMWRISFLGQRRDGVDVGDDQKSRPIRSGPGAVPAVRPRRHFLRPWTRPGHTRP